MMISLSINQENPGTPIVAKTPIITAIVETIVPNIVAQSSNFFPTGSLAKKCSVSVTFKSPERHLIVLNLSLSSNAIDNSFIELFLSRAGSDSILE